MVCQMIFIIRARITSDINEIAGLCLHKQRQRDARNFFGFIIIGRVSVAVVRRSFILVAAALAHTAKNGKSIIKRNRSAFRADARSFSPRPVIFSARVRLSRLAVAASANSFERFSSLLSGSSRP